ncbi:DUF6945 domain-containing protein [Enterobacter cancerogenus]|uniref:DUF6945 domain-containing protein n=1 Tax=Enterobacter cancerogenus TaxID=69218 RepID=UPI000734BAD0|nr:hypothetical protein [Enterobacter cancerogenus]HCA7803128.1 hypothetical protein [Enterobacter hormaechei]KTQ51005.1 hypothetical protein NS104_01420 [Enterobacter cancerogenus]KTQ52985.1 hypothetical protein NS111_07845 [Enterobacter cancerogenus]KTQ75369.1 hypothetical protein NS188_03900 [Enterobacter cancerogenus]KTQ80899.1 hypothetical protein NS31R_11580 [Enterobacter cancerogenus]
MTETVKTEVQRTPDEAYGVTEMRFLCASQIVIRSTGEVVKITDKMKLVYIYMMNQYIGFSSRKQQFYTDQRHIKAALDISRDTLSKVMAALKKLGIVETAGWKGNSESYTVHFFSDVADGLQVIHKEWKGVPAWDHERANKNFKSKNQKPTNEEKKGDGESDQGGAGKRDGVPPVGVAVDADLSGGDDAVNGGNAIQSPTVKSPDQPQMADIDTLNHWVEGHDNEGFISYGAMWGIAKPGAITDLIKSHIKKIQSDGYKGTRSAANDDLSGADARYKQQQAQRSAAAKQATNAPQQQEDEQLEFDDNEAF